MNVAIVGCNMMGMLHAQMAANAGFHVVKCVDKDLKTAKKLAKQYNAAATDDIQRALDRKDVDIVCIATPTTTHKQYIIAAAKAGKQIFCEKPLCRTVKECKEALAAVERAGVKLFVGHVVRYFHEFDAIQAQIKAGKIGSPGFVKMFRGGICPVGSDNWFRDFKQSGGVVFDSALHDLDWLRYTFGEIDRVFCQNLLRTDPEPMDYGMVSVRLSNGMIAQVIGSWAHPTGFRVTVEVCGSKGILQFNSKDSPLSAQQRKASGSGPTMIVPAQPVGKSPYQLEWEDFHAWLDRDRNPRVQPHDGLMAVTIGEAALKSAETGQPEAVKSA